jgi:hypothetical protein
MNALVFNDEEIIKSSLISWEIFKKIISKSVAASFQFKILIFGMSGWY